VLALNLITFVVGLVLGAFLGVFVNEYLRRPQLRPGLGGSGPGFASLSITNTLGHVGIYIGQTTILGRDITYGRDLGRRIERYPARCNSPSIMDADNPDGGAVGLCFGQPGVGEPETSAEIRSGESANLVLFGVRANDKQVFLFQPGPNWEPAPGSVPLTFDVPHKFVVRVSYDHGSSQVLNVPVAVTRDIQGHLHLEIPGASTHIQ